MVAASLLVTLNDVAMKWLTDAMPVGQILCLRGLVVVSVAFGLALHEGGLHRLRVGSLGLQSLRAGLVVAGMFCFITALGLLPLADAIALLFAAPLFATALAVPLLGERVGWRRWSAVLVGFVGVLVILRPGSGAFVWAALLPLTSALLGAIRDVVTRHLSRSDSSSGILMVTSVAVVLAGLATWPLGWAPVDLRQGALLVGAGLILALSHYLMIEALRFAEVATVVPFRYTMLIWATLFGFVFFGTTPDIGVICGALLVLVSGLYILQRERHTAASAEEPSCPNR